MPTRPNRSLRRSPNTWRRILRSRPSTESSVRSSTRSARSRETENKINAFDNRSHLELLPVYLARRAFNLEISCFLEFPDGARHGSVVASRLFRNRVDLGKAVVFAFEEMDGEHPVDEKDRKSTRLN